MAIPAVAESISGIRYHRLAEQILSVSQPFKPKTVLSKQKVRRRADFVQLNLIKRLSLHYLISA